MRQSQVLLVQTTQLSHVSGSGLQVRTSQVLGDGVEHRTCVCRLTDTGLIETSHASPHVHYYRFISVRRSLIASFVIFNQGNAHCD